MPNAILDDQRPIKSLQTPHKEFIGGTSEQVQRVNGCDKIFGLTSITPYAESDGSLWIMVLVDDEIIFRCAAANAEIEYELTPAKYVDPRKA